MAHRVKSGVNPTVATGDTTVNAGGGNLHTVPAGHVYVTDGGGNIASFPPDVWGSLFEEFDDSPQQTNAAASSDTGGKKSASQ